MTDNNLFNDELNVQFFDHNKIRREYDSEKEKWYFSVVDVVAALTDQEDFVKARKYWNKLAQRLKEEGSEVVTKCHRLKMLAQDRKMRETDVADVETILRLVQSVPSPKAEPIKLWLAKAGQEKLQEMVDPEKSLEKAVENWKKHGRSDKWISQRMSGQNTRTKLTDYWNDHDVKGNEFAILTKIIHESWTGITPQQHKEIKGLKSQNLRDHMSETELILTALAEVSTREIAESMQATGFEQNKIPAKEGGKIAKNTKLEIEKMTGKKVITSNNYLKPKKSNTKLQILQIKN